MGGPNGDQTSWIAAAKTLEPIADYSIWLVNCGCCYRFDLRGKPLEVLEELPSSDAGENKPSAHHSTGLRGIVPNGLINSDVCERQGYVAVYERGTYHFGCEQLPFMQRVLQDQL